MTMEQFVAAIQDEVQHLEETLRLDKRDSRSLVVLHRSTYDDLEEVKGVLDWVPQAQADAIGRKDLESFEHADRILRDALALAKWIFALQVATIKEITRRASRNKVNYYFGILKLAHDLEHVPLQEKALRHLRAMLLSIPRKKGWFHPGQMGGWVGVIDAVVTKQLSKLANTSADDVMKTMCDNGFAYVYKAARNRFVDEIRRIAANRRIVHVRDVLAAVEANPNRDLQLLGVVRVIEDIMRGEGGATNAILEEVRSFIGNPDTFEDQSVDRIRAHFAKSVADTRGVTVQQARADLRRFANEAEMKGTINALKKEIEELVRQAKLRVSIRESELDDGEKEPAAD
jgi:hypothetical protein